FLAAALPSAALLARNFRALLARLGQPDRDRLLAALHLAAVTFLPALERSLLLAMHRALDALARGFAVLPMTRLLPTFFRCHPSLPSPGSRGKRSETA